LEDHDDVKKKKISWKEAPAFHLIGLLGCSLCLLRSIVGFFQRFDFDGWDNEWPMLSIIFALLVWYFVNGCQSGLGEEEAVEDALKENNKRKGD
jgi:uncharacterized RDD family membrane protein YckC